MLVKNGCAAAAESMQMKWISSFAFLIALASAAMAAQSVYTNAFGKGCTDMGDRRDEAHGSIFRCPGPAGYAVVFTDEGNVVDARFGLRGKEQNLGGLQWSGGIGAKRVEWRVQNGAPFAAIFRVSKTNPETSETTEHLAVAKITPAGGCLIELVNARAADANARARSVADERAAAHVCGK